MTRTVRVLVLAAVLMAWARGAAAQEPGVGDAAPVLAVRNLDGLPVDLGQWIGQTPVFLEFWATWCTSCAALDPAVRAAVEAHGAEVTFIGVNITVAEDRDSVRAWLARHDPPWQVVLYDDEGASQRAYDVAETSYVVIVDRDGRIAYTGVGGAQNFGPALRRVTAP